MATIHPIDLNRLTQGAQRPPWPFGVNWANLITRGAVALIDPANAPLDIISRGTLAIGGGAPSGGVIGRAWALNGSSDYVDLTATLPNVSTDNAVFGFACWAYPTGASGSTRNLFASGTTSSGYGIQVRRSTAEAWEFYLAVGDTLAQQTGGVVTNRWTLVSGDWDGANMRLYTDGVLRATTAKADRGRAGPLLSYGADGNDYQPSHGQFWLGSLGPLWLWSRALSAAEHWALYDPASRWDLYAVPTRRAYVFVGGAAPTVNRRRRVFSAA